MDAFVSGNMDENAILDNLMDEEDCMFDGEGTSAFLSINPLYYELIEHTDLTRYAYRFGR